MDSWYNDMRHLQNLHTHTTFCDGKNTAEEMVQAAVAAGMTAIGFSGHSYVEGDSTTMSPDATAAYRTEVLRLREVYAGQIDIYLGLEQDTHSAPAAEPYDYRIGSVHYVVENGLRLCVDDTPEELCRAAAEAGGWPALVEDYYAAVAAAADRTGCQIIGHFDLITKFNEGDRLFSPDHPRCRAAALEALRTLTRREVLFEINTGAMARGYRTQPYPAPALLREIRALGGRILITSDCHQAQHLLTGFREARELALACGFRETMQLTAQGFVPQPL